MQDVYIRLLSMFKSKITHLETNPQHRIKTVYKGILYKAIKEENCLKLRWGQGRGNLEWLVECSSSRNIGECIQP